MADNKIRKVEQYKEDFIPKGIDSDKVVQKKYLFSQTFYDEEGNVVRDERYNQQGELEEYEEHVFDADSRLVETRNVLHGEEAEHRTYSHNAAGNVEYEYIHYVDGAKDTIEYRYAGAELKEKVFMDEDGEVEKKVLFERSGNEIRELIKDEDDGLTEEKTKVTDGDRLLEEAYKDHFSGQGYKLKYHYSTEGKEIATERFDEGGGLVEHIEKSYDDKGQVIKVEDKVNQRIMVLEYDDKGNLVFQEERLADGTVASTIIRSYDAENLHSSSEVFLNGLGQQMSERYNVYRVYTFFD